MKNKHSTSGMAEDLIRSFVHIAADEMHKKTLLEKHISELENGIIKDEDIQLQLDLIEELRESIDEIANIRRDDMLLLYNLFGAIGDKEQWCSVKHLGVAMITAFETWQASEDDEALFQSYISKNALFIKAMTKFLGVEVTDCASCFADILNAQGMI